MFRAEQGERLGVLDRLLGSTSFMGTIITAVTMPSSILLTLALLPIWALSPLGSQASFRAFHWEANRTETATIFPYLSMNNSENIDGRRNAVASHSLLLGALGGSSRCIDSPVDLWGNVKIPSIEALMKVGRRSDQDGWYDLNSLAGGNITLREYSSLIGTSPPTALSRLRTSRPKYIAERLRVPLPESDARSTSLGTRQEITPPWTKIGDMNTFIASFKQTRLVGRNPRQSSQAT